ncbi:MAG: PBSX family phage terminase large subunit [Ruthenibacterium lactatiformans]
MSPAFYELHTQIKTQRPHTVVCKGGRGSTKSSFMSVEFILFLLQHPQCHGVVLRKIAMTLRNSVYAQIQWAIGALGLQNKFRCTVSPMEITYLATGQKILFFGLDKPEKLKSIKLPFGYIGVDWFEEADQFAGEAEIRNVKQSTLRGGEFAMTFLSFNPPAAARNWANRYALEAEPGKIVHHSTYLTTPRDWLGQRFLDDAEHLKQTKPTSYRHEYLGEAVGNGTQVFDNIRLEPITKAQINSFGEITSGVDWGWYPDPWAFNRMSYDAARRTLYIFDELTRRKLNNFETARLVLSRIPEGEDVIADSAEKKSCGDYRDMGINCFDAVKKPGSVRTSIMWLQGLASIVIDPVRCPDTAKEFSEYEYAVAKDGEVIPDMWTRQPPYRRRAVWHQPHLDTEGCVMGRLRDGSAGICPAGPCRRSWKKQAAAQPGRGAAAGIPDAACVYGRFGACLRHGMHVEINVEGGGAYADRSAEGADGQ